MRNKPHRGAELSSQHHDSPGLEFEPMKYAIADIAQVRSGYQFRSKVEHDPHGTVHVIQIKDLSTDFTLSTNDLIRVSMSKTTPYLVHQGEVLFLARGHRLGAAVITEQVKGTIATGYFFILRPSEMVLPGYLAWAMNQKEFQDQMRPLVRGSHIPLITKGDLVNLQLEVPSLAVQHAILTLDDLRRSERNLVSKLEEKRDELIHGLCLRAITRDGKRKRTDA